MKITVILEYLESPYDQVYPVTGRSGRVWGYATSDAARGGRHTLRMTLDEFREAKDDLFVTKRNCYYPVPDIEVLIEPGDTAENSGVSEVIAKLLDESGAIVNTGECSELEIADAKETGRFFAVGDNFAVVRRTKKWLELNKARENEFPREGEGFANPLSAIVAKLTEERDAALEQLRVITEGADETTEDGAVDTKVDSLGISSETIPGGSAREILPDVETKVYGDGTTATGVAPLPEGSPASSDPEPAAEAPAVVNYDEMDVHALRDLANSRGLKGLNNARRETIAAKLRAADQAGSKDAA